MASPSAVALPGLETRGLDCLAGAGPAAAAAAPAGCSDPAQQHGSESAQPGAHIKPCPAVQYFVARSHRLAQPGGSEGGGSCCPLCRLCLCKAAQQSASTLPHSSACCTSGACCGRSNVDGRKPNRFSLLGGRWLAAAAGLLEFRVRLPCAVLACTIHIPVKSLFKPWSGGGGGYLQAATLQTS